MDDESIKQRVDGQAEAGGVDITLVGRFKHGALYAAARKLGGQAALARHLGVDQVTVGKWCNLKGCPPIKPEEISGSSRWTPKRIDELEAKLFELTGLPLESLFPDELRRLDPDALSKEVIRTRRIPLAQLPAAAIEARYPGPDEQLETIERREIIGAAISHLPFRERNVITMRFFAGMDLEQTARVLRVNKNRIRQIELRALQRLKTGRDHKQLKQLIAPNETTTEDK